jgi:hypothetical protein
VVKQDAEAAGLWDCRIAHGLTATTIAAVFAVLLNWRAWNRAIGTVNTAVTRLRLDHSVTLLAFVEPLTCIRWHVISVLA